MDLQEKAFPAAFTPAAIVLYQRTDHAVLTPADQTEINRITTALGRQKIDQVQKVIDGSTSKDGKHQTALVQMDKKSAGQPKQADSAKALRADAAGLAKGTGLTVQVGGQAAQNLDQQDAGQTSDALALFGSLLIIITLAIIFRSPLIAILPLVLLVGVVFTVANALIADATKIFGLQANSSISALLSAGAAEPTSVFLSSTDGKPLTGVDFTAYADELRGADGVAAVAFDQNSDLNKAGTTADFTVTLKYEAASDQAIKAVGGVRTIAHDNAPPGTQALVGGSSSVYKDINVAVNHDYRTVFPVAAVLIMVILGLLLRSVVAPWYLIASVGLGSGATLGATVLIFGRGDGLIFLLPIIMYMFVVAIGTDYNILMIARLREEAREGRHPREAASEALRHAGPTIGAAGLILAATFATVMLSGNAFLTEMGFAVAFGIVVAAFVMAMFFTPSLTAFIGHAAWWPGHADRDERSVLESGNPGGAGLSGGGPGSKGGGPGSTGGAGSTPDAELDETMRR